MFSKQTSIRRLVIYWFVDYQLLPCYHHGIPFYITSCIPPSVHFFTVQNFMNDFLVSPNTLLNMFNCLLRFSMLGIYRPIINSSQPFILNQVFFIVSIVYNYCKIPFFKTVDSRWKFQLNEFNKTISVTSLKMTVIY